MLIALLEAVRPLEQRSNDAVLGAIQLDWLILQRSQALVGMDGLQSANGNPIHIPSASAGGFILGKRRIKRANALSS